MSLNWDVSKVKDYKEVTEEGAPWVITETLIWYTMAVDMGRITEDNAEEFFQRVSVWEEIHGAGMRKWNKDEEKNEPMFMTLEDIQRRVGLSTNVITRSREEWSERIAEILFDRAYRELCKQRKAED